MRPHPKGGPFDKDSRAPMCPRGGKVGGKAQEAVAAAYPPESRAVFDVESMFLEEENVSFSSAQGCDAMVQAVSGF